MRTLKSKTIEKYCKRFPRASKAIRTWSQIVKSANWANHSELKSKLGSASIINKKRVVFNICGNNYRLVADINYQTKFVYVVWFGTHKDYDKIDVKEISYVDD